MKKWKYYVVNTTIKDGEYEYLSQTPIMAVSAENAVLEVEQDVREWTADDYREYEIGNPTEITKKEFAIVSRLIY